VKRLARSNGVTASPSTNVWPNRDPRGETPARMCRLSAGPRAGKSARPTRRDDRRVVQQEGDCSPKDWVADAGEPHSPAVAMPTIAFIIVIVTR